MELKLSSLSLIISLPGDTICMQATAGAPKALSKAMLDHGVNNNLRNVRVFHLLSQTIPDYVKPEYKDIFRVEAAFVGPLDREAVHSGRADFTPIFLSDVPRLFNQGIVKPKICMLQVTPPDEHGYLSMGVSVVGMRAAIKHCEMIIGEVNSNQPRTFGDSLIHQSHFDFLIKNDSTLDGTKPSPSSDVEKAIGKHIADNLVENGATLQLGIGGIPDAVLAQCKQHKNLGIHSEMISDGVIDLVENGNINNLMKKTDNGLIVSTFLLGSERFYRYFDNNPYLRK